jgi:hypothetical protein
MLQKRMKRQGIMNRLLLLLSILFCSTEAASAADMEIRPFSTFNQSPLTQIYGLPHDTGADIVPSGKFRIAFNQDLSSNYTVSKSSREKLTLDGEAYRMTMAVRYGAAPQWEVGIEIPYIIEGGGFLDNFIINWHNTFGLPQGGRTLAPKNHINYSYNKDGVQSLLLDRSASGIGDVSLTGGFSLLDLIEEGRNNRLAIKGAVKFPTGDSTYLLGSGSTDLMLQLCGSMNNYTEWGSLGVYGSVGALAMSKSDVLRDQHNPLAGVGTLGLGWGPASWISFKVQLNGATPLYRDSSLDEISKSSILLILGGALKFPGGYLLDLGVGEDVAVATAPDVSFHMGLSKQF